MDVLALGMIVINYTDIDLGPMCMYTVSKHNNCANLFFVRTLSNFDRL